MRDFLKTVVAVVIGIAITFILLFYFGVLVMFSAWSTSSTEAKVGENSVLHISLDNSWAERSTDDPLSMLTGDEPTVGLDQIRAAIAQAKENDNVKGIYLEAGSLSAGMASVEEIRKALDDFRASGKFVIAYGDTYTQGAYYLCSVADRVILNPQGMLDWHGLASLPLFYTGLLEKIGVEVQVFKVGTYKSAVEPYINKKMSDANRQQMTELLNAAWGKLVADVARSRQLTPAVLNQEADRVLALRPASEALACGMVDTLMYAVDVKPYIKQIAGIDEDDKLHLVSPAELAAVKQKKPKDKSGNIIAVYYAEGTITDTNLDGPLMTRGNASIAGDKMSADLIRLKDDDDVKAVVIRVNSPGGSAYASEQICNAIAELKKSKPVIISMGDYAASGGYYISCKGDVIVADSTTLTGSIGIFGMFPNFGKLADKAGLGFDVVKTNAHSDFGNTLRAMDNSEREILQAYIERGYDIFLTRCSEGRGISKVDLDKIAQGRVWIGSEAVRLGLVDEIGDIDRAIELAVELSNVGGYTLKSYPDQPSFIETLLTAFDDYVDAKAMGKLGQLGRQLLFIQQLADDNPVQAIMPYRINID